MPADLAAIAILALAALTAPLAADWRRRLATRRFDAIYERNLLHRTGRAEPGPGEAAATGPRRRGRGR
jgi:hypothetical protein